MFPEAITKSIKEFAATFAERPFDYLFEADVQAYLHGRLSAALEADPVDLDQVRWRGQLQVPELKVSRVHAEYPTSKRFDLALVAECDSQSPIWNQPVGAAVELKLWQADDSGAGINGDLRKLHAQLAESGNRAFLGVVLIACHPGKDVATVGALDGRTPRLEPVAGPINRGVFVCAVNAEKSAQPLRWWQSVTPPASHPG
jgi:hypothetical protein